MRRIVDAQLPPTLARWLASRGHEATHVADLGMARAPDEAIWVHALAVEAVIITKDSDFASRRMNAGSGPAIVWLRLPNMRRQELLDRLEIVIPAIVSAFASGETLIEIV